MQLWDLQTITCSIQLLSISYFSSHEGIFQYFRDVDDKAVKPLQEQDYDINKDFPEYKANTNHDYQEKQYFKRPHPRNQEKHSYKNGNNTIPSTIWNDGITMNLASTPYPQLVQYEGSGFRMVVPGLAVPFGNTYTVNCKVIADRYR